MPVNAFESGFQNNTTIHAAFWIYKPDFTFDPKGKEVDGQRQQPPVS